MCLLITSTSRASTETGSQRSRPRCIKIGPHSYRWRKSLPKPRSLNHGYQDDYFR